METETLVPLNYVLIAVAISGLISLIAILVAVRAFSKTPADGTLKDRSRRVPQNKGLLSVSVAVNDKGNVGYPDKFPKLTITVHEVKLPPKGVVFLLRTNLFDVTGTGFRADLAQLNDCALPVLSVTTEYHSKGSDTESTLFELEQKLPPPGADGQPAKPKPEEVPLDYLVFPRSGDRKVLAVTQLFVDNGTESVMMGYSETEIKSVGDAGYLDQPHTRWLADHLAVRLAVVMAKADGDFDRAGREQRVIEEWVERRISGLNPEEQALRRDFLLHPLRKAATEAKNPAEPAKDEDTARFRDIVGEMKKIATLPALYDYANLCFDVMKADTVAHDTERELITRIQEVAGLDAARCRALLDLRLSNTQRETLGQLWPDREISPPHSQY